MVKTIDEVVKWLDSTVGTITPDKSDSTFDGQCVSLVKNLLEILGVPDPYAARGNAKDYGDALLAQGIADNGRGLLNIHVNRSGGGGYGHTWVAVGADNWQANYITKPVKKNYPQDPISQTVNLDKWLTTTTTDNTTEEKGEEDMIKLYSYHDAAVNADLPKDAIVLVNYAQNTIQRIGTIEQVQNLEALTGLTNKEVNAARITILIQTLKLTIVK